MLAVGRLEGFFCVSQFEYGTLSVSAYDITSVRFKPTNVRVRVPVLPPVTQTFDEVT